MKANKKVTAAIAAVLALVLVLSLVPSLPGSLAHAATSEEIRDQINDLKDKESAVQDQIEDLKNSIAENVQELEDMLDRKDNIDSQVMLLHKQIDIVTQQVSAFNLLIADKQEEMDIAQRRLDTLLEKYKHRIRDMEEQGEVSYWSVIFQATSFADLLDRLNMIAEIAHADKMRLQELEKVAAQVSEAKEILAREKRELESSKLGLQLAQEDLAAKRAESDRLLQEMIAKGDEYKELMSKAEQAQMDLMNQIAQKELDYDAQAYKEWLATSVPPTTTSPAGPGQVVEGIVWYIPTVDYYVSSEFGFRTHPVTGEPDTHHDGIDLAAYEGTPIYATRSGVVTVASVHWSAGVYVNLNHGDGYTSIYMHMTHFVVELGEYVSAGQLIGYVGRTGRVTGPHLHFGIAYKGRYQNPRKYLDF